MPYLSVIVPIYKVEQYLSECIESIMEQTFTDMEIILVDDGGQDKCPSICDAYAKKDSRIKVIHKENGGLVSARKAGLQEATGEYVAFVDGDDSIERNMYECMCASAYGMDADIVAEGFTFIYPDKTEVWKDRVPAGEYDRKALEEQIYPVMMCHENKLIRNVAPAIWSKIFKRGVITPVLSEMDERIKDGEDAAVTYPCFLRAERIIFLTDKHHYKYRINTESMSRSYDPAWYESASAYCDWMDRMIGGRGDALRESLKLEKFMMFHRYLNREYVYCRENAEEHFAAKIKTIVEETAIGKSIGQINFGVLEVSLLEKMKYELLKRKRYKWCQMICAISYICMKYKN